MTRLTPALVRMRKTLVSTKLTLILFVDFFFYFPVLRMLAKIKRSPSHSHRPPRWSRNEENKLFNPTERSRSEVAVNDLVA